MEIEFQQRVEQNIREIENYFNEEVLIYKLDSLHWNIKIKAPQGSPYENNGILLSFDFNFDQNFPISPPEVVLQTKICHLNFNQNGKICKHIIEDKWTKDSSLLEVMITLIGLIKNPILDCSLVPQLAYLFKFKHENYSDYVASHSSQQNI